MSQQKPLESEIKRDNKIVADWLLWYPDRKAEYERRREEILDSSSGPSLSDAIPGNKNVLSDPTGRKAQQLAELQEIERWLQLVEEVEERLPAKMRIFLRLRRQYRYARGRQGWTARMQREFAQVMARESGRAPEDVWIESRQTFWTWWNRIVDFAARLAAKKGLL